MKLKKLTALFMVAVMGMTMITGCGSSDEGITKDTEITVISREEGSGTRDAFVELFEITDADGNDITVATAEQNSSTSVVITTVKDNPAAIGYISLGSLNDDIKAVKVDGVEATAENVKNGTYKVSRPFNVAYKEDSLSQVAADFMKYVLSTQGQAVVTAEGYIAIDVTDDYVSSNLSGTVKISGSTSVAPVMKVLAEEYEGLNPNVDVQVSEGGSSAGMTNAIEGVSDIGMASRAVKDSEIAKGLTSAQIAIDGIAVIVNENNELGETLTSEQIKGIYKGEITKWSLED
ncbi:MAG: substrate-binding domain-containing protein [Lachnospiraceae bacterium]|nr:substrate-binding domain-containing protein [Lachnospiraceae bacterium]